MKKFFRKLIAIKQAIEELLEVAPDERSRRKTNEYNKLCAQEKELMYDAEGNLLKDD